MTARATRQRTAGICSAVLAGIVVASAGGAPSAVDVQVDVGASTSVRGTLAPNGSTVSVPSLDFYVFVEVSLITPAAASAGVAVQLGDGLVWGEDEPDATEGCTSTSTTGTCRTPPLEPITGRSSVGWYWQVKAPQPGTYSFGARIVEASDADPEPANDASSIAIVVSPSSGGGEGGGSGDGGGGSRSAVSVGSVRIAPARPRAGSSVSATARVSAGEVALRPGRVTCTGSIGTARVTGAPRAAVGTATCTYRTPRSAKGKSLRGAVAVTARGQRFTRRFAVRLG